MNNHQLGLYVFVLSLSCSSCQLVNNTIQGTIGTIDTVDSGQPTPTEPPILKLGSLDEFLYVKSDYPLEISGGSPPFTAEVLEGNAIIDLSQSKIQTGNTSGKTIIEIHDSLGRSSTLELPIFPQSRGSETPLGFDGYLSPNGNYLIYEAKPDGSSHFHGYSQNLSTHEIVKLTQVIDPAALSSFSGITPDGTRFVYGAQSPTDGHALYSVKLDGSDHRKISDPILGSSWILFANGMNISPDSSKVAYIADLDGDGWKELVVAPILGEPNTIVSDRPVSMPQIRPQFTSDSQKIIYLARKDTVSIDDYLYASSVTGTGSIQLHADMTFSGEIKKFKLVEGTHIAVYVANQDDFDNDELYRTSADSAASEVKLHPSIAGTTKDIYLDYQIAPDGSAVVFAGTLNSVPEYFSVLLAGAPSPVRLNSAFSGGEISSGRLVEISSDSSRVLYKADVDVDGGAELYTVPIGGGTSTQITPTPVTGGGFTNWASFTPDGNRVVFLGDFDVDEKKELYSVSSLGGPVKKLSGTGIADNIDVYEFAISPDSSLVTYSTNREGSGIISCWVNGIDPTQEPYRPYLSQSQPYLSSCQFGRSSHELLFFGDLIVKNLNRYFLFDF
ncbi:MAG: hypothetical protein KDD35_00205 [Bdellovibrionales bacterium]|nr:hypothetical protein [Bdellovibrionales bacterium]